MDEGVWTRNLNIEGVEETDQVGRYEVLGLSPITKVPPVGTMRVYKRRIAP